MTTLSRPSSTSARTTTQVMVNGRFLGQPLTGVQRYAFGVLGALPEQVRETWAVLPPHRQALPVRTPPGRTRLPGSSGARAYAWEQVALPLRARRHRARVLVNLCNTAPLCWPRQVVVLHDAAPLLHPEMFTRSYAATATLLLHALARTGSHLVTVSESARGDLVQALRLDPERVSVIPPGATHLPTSGPGAEPSGVDGPFALFVGGHDPRKNLDLLRAAWPQVWRRLGLRLVVVARPDATVHRGGSPAPVDWLTVVPGPSDARLAQLYRAATCVVSPSLYEGFGLPLLEGMVVGTPFLSSAAGAAPQLAVRPWQLLPLDPEAWIEGLAQVASLPSASAAGLAQDLRARAAGYEWAVSARCLVALVDRVAAT